MRYLLSIFCIVLVLVVLGCQESKFPVNSLPQGDIDTKIGDTVYVQQNPQWTGFNHPQAVIVGNEPFVYVADTDNDRIVMLDIAYARASYTLYDGERDVSSKYTSDKVLLSVGYRI